MQLSVHVRFKHLNVEKVQGSWSSDHIRKLFFRHGCTELLVSIREALEHLNLGT